MVTTKTTSHCFTTSRGNKVVCTITRTYGLKCVEAHEETVWLDQPITVNRPAEDEFVNEYEISVSINGEVKDGFDYCTGFGGKYNEDGDFIGGFNGLRDCRNNIIIPLSAEDDEIISNLITERLNDDISVTDADDIESVKSHIADNIILPQAELNARRKEYRDGMLEGGEGFNPYAYYISREFADRIIKRFPKYFK